jgi:TonB family protein
MIAILLFCFSIGALSAETSATNAGPPDNDSPTGSCAGVFKKAESIYAPIPLGALLHEECKSLGTPVVSFRIGKDGRPDNVKIRQSSRCKKADAELIRCIAKWVFTPATCDGIAQDSESNVSVNWGRGVPPPAPTEACPSFKLEPQR